MAQAGHGFHGQMAARNTQFGLHPNLSWSYDVSLQIDDRKVSPLERRLAITYALSATATLCTACVAVATISGGLFASAAPSMNGGVKQVELVDDYIVVHSPTTTIPTAPQSALMQAFVVAPTTTAAPAPTDPPTTVAPAPVAKVQPPAPAPAPAPIHQAAPPTTPPETTVPRPVRTYTPVTRSTTTHTQPATTSGTYQRHNHQSTGNTQPSDDHGGDD